MAKRGKESRDTSSPRDQAEAALEAAVERLEEASEQNNPARAGALEQEALEILQDGVGKALADGLNQPVSLYAGAFDEAARYLTKTDVKQRIKEASEAYRGDDKLRLDEFIEDRLESVAVVGTTDHLQGKEFIWDFGTFKVETQGGKDGRGHYNWYNFREYIYESGGVNLARPERDRRGGEEWREFIAGIIDDRREIRTIRGSRTEAVEGLSRRIRRLTGYGTVEAALDRSGIWIIRETREVPDWWATFGRDPSTSTDLPGDVVDEVRVHESVLESILEDCDITRSAFYHELNARNHTIPGTSGASTIEYVGGSEERFWTLLPSIGLPAKYVTDPNASISDSPTLPAETHNRTIRDGEPNRDGKASIDDGFDSVGDVR